MTGLMWMVVLSVLRSWPQMVRLAATAFNLEWLAYMMQVQW